MTGKRKFIVTLTFLIGTIVLTGFAIKSGVVLSGNDFQSIILWIAGGTAMLGGAMAVENISQAGGIRAFFGKVEQK